MSLVTVAILLIACFAGGGTYWIAERGGTGAWVAFTLGLLVYSIVSILAR